MISVCFVCLGNICRSPTAEGVMLKNWKITIYKMQSSLILLEHLLITLVKEADARSRECAQREAMEYRVELDNLRSKIFERFDYIIAMDQSNLQNLLQSSNEEQRQKIYMFRQFEEGMNSQSDVPDPYYGGPSGFDNVLDICERGCDGLIEFLKQNL